jgi:ribose/xylose/arabinose/galactoside ABC-type transport system permease subunit
VIARTAAPPFIVTLGAASVIQGIVFWYTDSATYGTPAPSFGEIGFEDFGPLPALVVLFIPLLVISLIAQNRTRAGRHVYAVGDDDEVAERAGVRVARVKIGIYALSGALAALAGVAVATRTGAGEPLSGTGFDWDSVAAVVIGGAALTGGKGGVGGTMIGVLIIATIDNAMTLQNVSSFWQSTVKGLIVLAAVIIAAISAKDLLRRYLRRGALRRGALRADAGPAAERSGGGP